MSETPTNDQPETTLKREWNFEPILDHLVRVAQEAQPPQPELVAALARSRAKLSRIFQMSELQLENRSHPWIRHFDLPAALEEHLDDFGKEGFRASLARISLVQAAAGAIFAVQAKDAIYQFFMEQFPELDPSETALYWGLFLSGFIGAEVVMTLFKPAKTIIPDEADNWFEDVISIHGGIVTNLRQKDEYSDFSLKAATRANLVDHKRANDLIAGIDGDTPQMAMHKLTKAIQSFRTALLKAACKDYVQQLRAIGPQLKKIEQKKQECAEHGMSEDKKDEVLQGFMSKQLPIEFAEQMGTTLEFIQVVERTLKSLDKVGEELAKAHKDYLAKKSKLNDLKTVAADSGDIPFPEQEEELAAAHATLQQEKNKLRALITVFRTRFGSKVTEPSPRALEEGLNLDDAALEVAKKLHDTRIKN